VNTVQNEPPSWRERYENANLRIVELMGQVSDLWEERDALRALLAELRRLEQWRDDDDRELMACRARVDAALRETTPAA
jgi:hypothetical protein